MYPKDFIDFIEALHEAAVDYVIVGGIAVGFHGHVRSTKDLDVLVNPTPANAKRVMSALKAFRAPLGRISEKDFASAEVVFQIGVPPLRIDVTTVIDGVDFSEATRQHKTVDFGGVPAKVIGLKALLKNKRAAGRPQDLADVALLGKRTR